MMHRFPARLAAALTLAASALAVSSCGSDSDNGTGPTGAITLTLSSTSATIAPGGQAVVVGTVTRSGGFTGDVAITATGVPTGVTGTVGAVTTIGLISTAAVTLNLAGSTAAGTYPITVKATGSGVSDVSVTYTLTVSATAQSYTLAVAPTGINVAAGGNQPATVTINRSNFTGAVTLSVPNLPTGITADFAPNNTTTNSSTMTVNVGAAVAAGLYQLTIKGVATGQPDQLIFLGVTVPATGTFTVAVAPTTVNVAQNGNNTATVTIARSGGFAGNVGLTTTGNPALLTTSFSPSSVSGTSSTLTLTALSGLATGNYTVTIHGAAAGFSTDQTVQLTVNVTAAGGSGNAVVNFASCAATSQPIWFAYQDGPAGAWTVVTGTNNVYSFTVAQPKVGFAYVAQSGASNFLVNIVYYTNSELTSAPLINCTPGGTNSMSGTVAGLTTLQKAEISLGASATAVSFPTTAYTLTKLPSGSFDLLGYMTSALGTPAAGDRLIIRRNQLVQNLGTIPVLDFSSGEAVAPAQATITTANDGGGSLTAQMVYYSTNCTSNGSLYLLLGPTSPFNAFGVPAGSQLAGDFHSLNVGVTNGSNIRGATEWFHTLANRTITLPTAITTPTITSLGGNYKRLQAVYTLPAEYTSGTTFSYFDATTGAHFVSMTATNGYLGGSAVTLAMPTFTGLTGWLDTWAPASGTTVTTGVQASGVNMTGSLCQEGYRLVSDQVSGSN